MLDNRTLIRWTPIFEESQGNRFRTVSFFVNDQWTLDRHFTFNLGLRYDRNDGKDASGSEVVKDSAWSPRLAVTLSGPSVPSMSWISSVQTPVAETT